MTGLDRLRAKRSDESLTSARREIERLRAELAGQEDNRISKIRDVLDAPRDPFDDGGEKLARIRAILDSAPPAPDNDTRPLWQITIRVPDDVAGRDDLFSRVAEVVHDWEPDDRDGWDADVTGHPTDYLWEENTRLRHLVGDLDRSASERPPAPRVFFPGDTVPRDVVAEGEEEVVVGPYRVRALDGPFVELATLPPEEWQAAVDRARDARADAEWQHTEGTNP